MLGLQVQELLAGRSRQGGRALSRGVAIRSGVGSRQSRRARGPPQGATVARQFSHTMASERSTTSCTRRSRAAVETPCQYA